MSGRPKTSGKGPPLAQRQHSSGGAPATLGAEPSLSVSEVSSGSVEFDMAEDELAYGDLPPWPATARAPPPPRPGAPLPPRPTTKHGRTSDGGSSAGSAPAQHPARPSSRRGSDDVNAAATIRLDAPTAWQPAERPATSGRPAQPPARPGTARGGGSGSSQHAPRPHKQRHAARNVYDDTTDSSINILGTSASEISDFEDRRRAAALPRPSVPAPPPAARSTAPVPSSRREATAIVLDAEVRTRSEFDCPKGLLRNGHWMLELPRHLTVETVHRKFGWSVIDEQALQDVSLIARRWQIAPLLLLLL